MHKLATRIQPSEAPQPHPAKALRRKALAMLNRLAPAPRNCWAPKRANGYCTSCACTSWNWNCRT